MDTKINIYVSFHKKFINIPCKHYIPIQVGAAISDEKLDMIGDNRNELDNISYKQARYSDVTSHYHALRNDIDGDYIGFVHYRRMFFYNNLNEEISLTNDILKDANALGINDQRILEVVPNYDILLPSPITYNVCVYDYLCNNYTKDLMDMFIQVIRDLYPNYNGALNAYFFGNEGFYYNMFIMKRELFMEYAEFKFNCLFELEKRLKENEITDLFPRLFGYLSEFFITIYILYRNSLTPLKMTMLPLLIIDETDENGVNNYYVNRFHLPE
ncbi:MAG: DUF4422 domain-containing protein [Clostridium sp.]